MREEDLPSPEELIPLSQTLISPHLRLAFNIPSPNAPQTPSPQPPQSKQEFDSGDLGSGGDEPARTLKRPRLVWTPQLHKRFVDAVAHLGIKNAVPKTIMQLMSVDGLTRENVASHLQKYRLYLKRMQGLSGGGGLTSAASVAADAATDQLFASSPVPPHFLPFLHHQQMAAASTAPHHQLRPHFHHQYTHRQVGQFGSLPNGQFEHPFMVRQSQPVHRMGAQLSTSIPGSYVDDLESATAAAAGRKALTLFPAGDD